MKKSLLMMTMAASVLVSCSDNETNEMPVNGAVNIQLKSVHQTLNAESAATRAPYLGTISATNPLEARVLSSVTKDDYSTLHAGGKMTFIGGANISAYDASTVDASKMMFPGQNEDELYLFGLHPFEGWGTFGTTTEFTFTGKEDVMVASQVATSADDVKTANYASLTFKHILTKLEVSFKANNNAAIGVWGNVAKIELVKANGVALNNKVTVALADDAAPQFAGNTSGVPFSFYQMSNNAGTLSYTDDVFEAQSFTLTTTETALAYSLIAPFEADGIEDLTFNVWTENAVGGYKEVSVGLKGLDGLNAFIGNTEGRAFSILFNFDANLNTIVASASVIDWVYSGKSEVIVD